MKRFGKLPSLTVAMLTVLLTTSACTSKDESKVSHLEKGKALMEKGDLDKARVEIKNAMQIDPKYAEAYYQNGVLEEKLENYSRAYGNYMKVLELVPDHLEAKTKLARIQIMAGEVDKADKAVDEVLAKKPDFAAALILKAGSMARKGATQDAIDLIEKVIAANPGEVDAYQLLSYIQRSKGQADQSLSTLLQGIQKNPQDIVLKSAYLNTLLLQGKKAEAEPVFREIIRLDPKNMSYRIAFARYYAETKQIDKGEQVLRDAVKEDTTDQQRVLALAEYLAANSQEHGQAAERELKSAIQSIPKAYKLQFGLARLYQASKQQDKAVQTYQDIIKSDDTGPDGLKARNLLAQVQYALGNKLEAEQLVNEVLKENPKDNDAQMLRGQIYLGQGKAKEAILDLRGVQKNQPDSANVVALLARAHQMNNEPEIAKETVVQAVQNYPKSVSLKQMKADFLLSQKDVDGALQELDSALKLEPGNSATISAKVRILESVGNWADAEKFLNENMTARPKEMGPVLLLGQLYFKQKKYDQSIRQFSKVMEAIPTSQEAFLALIRSQIAAGKQSDALMLIQQKFSKNPGAYVPQLLMAQVHLSQRKFPEAEAELKRALISSPQSPDVLRDLVAIYMNTGRQADAEQLMATVVGKAPKEIGLRYMQAGILQQVGKTQEAISVYRQIISQKPTELVAVNNLASLLIETGKDTKTFEEALKIALPLEKAPNPALRDTLGWAYYKLNRFEQAKPILEGVVKQAAGSYPLFQYHLGMTYYRLGSKDQAKTLLKQALEGGNYPGKEEAKATLGLL